MTNFTLVYDSLGNFYDPLHHKNDLNLSEPMNRKRVLQKVSLKMTWLKKKFYGRTTSSLCDELLHHICNMKMSIAIKISDQLSYREEQKTKKKRFSLPMHHLNIPIAHCIITCYVFSYSNNLP